ncbi:MAG: hypothetical protein NT163_05910 [Chlorobiales bacterium]|nr:hypothetical protein [Chlorobiales bacterium]
MKSSFRFLSIAAINMMLASNAVYAHNSPSLTHGEAQLKAGHYKEAIADFTKAIESKPKLGSDDLSKAYYSRAVAERAIGSTEAAKADYKKSIEVDPTPVDAQGYQNRGLAKSYLGDTEGAQSDFNKAGLSGNDAVNAEIQNK